MVIDFLNKVFPSTDFLNTNDRGYVMVKCPFHLDDRESAGINPIDGFFKCFACEVELQGNQFIKKYLKLSNPNINDLVLDQQVQLILTTNGGIMLNEVETNAFKLQQDNNKLFDIMSLGISYDTIIETKLGIDENNGKNALIALPYTFENNLIGYWYYTPAPDKKLWTSKSMKTGWVCPFDNWVNDNRITLICEGGKDMLVARSNGFNAITLNGGCKAKINPILLPYFKNKDIVIAYDNDEAGLSGAKKLALQLWDYGIQSIRILTNWYEVIKEPKEDLTDFFIKYQCNRDQLINYINTTKPLTQNDIEDIRDKYEGKKISLSQAVEVEQRKILRSTIQVKTIPNQAPHKVPKYLYINVDTIITELANDNELKFNIKIDLTDFKFIQFLFTMIEGGAKKDRTIQTLLLSWFNRGLLEKYYIEALKPYDITIQKLGYKDVKNFIKDYLPINICLDPKISWYRYYFDNSNFTTIYTSTIGDYVENSVDNIQDNTTIEFKTYSYTPLITSKIYDISYELIPNEFDKSINIVLIKEAVESDSLKNFELNENIKKSLDKFTIPYTDTTNIQMKLQQLYLNVKEGRIKKDSNERFNSINHLNFDLWLLNELVFNSCLAFKLNNKIHRGVVYANVIGDTRVGKSEIVEQLISIYQKGKKIDAKNSTLLSLVGGSAGKNNEFIRAGVFPRNNGGLVAVEELHGLGQDYFKQTTEIKSSGRVKIQRVSGDLELQCFVRIIEISNPISNNNVKGVNAFANGAEVIQSLIKTPEDIARNDVYFVIAQSDNISPIQPQIDESLLWKQEVYKDKLKWVWSRKVENIFFKDENYIYDRVKETFKDNFTCPNLPLLGTEGYIKVAKLSIALAAMLANHSDDYENIIVSNSHIDYICDWLYRIYSSTPMLINTYISNENKYIHYTEQDVIFVRNKYTDTSNHNFKDIVNILDTQSSISINDLSYKLGCKSNDLGMYLKPFAENYLIMTNNQTGLIVSTAKFRKILSKLKEPTIQTTDIF